MKLLVRITTSTVIIFAAVILPATAQSIQVQVLNARNGRPVINEKVNISVYGVRDGQTFTTGSDGAFYLQLDSGARLFAGTEWWITCSERKTNPDDAYFRVQDVIDHGITLRNTCGRAKRETIKGRLIFFARKASFIEKFQR